MSAKITAEIGSLCSSGVPEAMAKWVRRLVDALMEEGFTREEAMRIVTSPAFKMGD